MPGYIRMRELNEECQKWDKNNVIVKARRENTTWSQAEKKNNEPWRQWVRRRESYSPEGVSEDTHSSL